MAGICTTCKLFFVFELANGLMLRFGSKIWSIRASHVCVMKVSYSAKNIVMYGHTYSKSMNQPGKVANPARGHLNREKMIISKSAFVPENLVSRERFGRSIPRQPVNIYTQAARGAYLRDSF